MNRLYARRCFHPYLLFMTINLSFIFIFLSVIVILKSTLLLCDNIYLIIFIILLHIVVIFILIYSYLTIIRDCFYIIDNSLKINLGRIIIPYEKIKIVIISLYLGAEGRSGEYFIKKQINKKITYIADIGIYVNEDLKIEEYYNNRIVNTQLNGKKYVHITDFHKTYKMKTNFNDIKYRKESIYDFNCYDFNSINDMLAISQAKIYVTRSYLYFNKWTINEFARKINVDLDRIIMINDNPFYQLTQRQIDKLEK